MPFERGGAEIFADDLVAQLRARDHEAELVTVPFKWYPGERVLTQAFLWRLLDLEEANGRPIDAVIATKFPSYAVRHPRKVVWLLHQFRQAWDLDRTELGQFSESAEDRALRRRVLAFERTALGEARTIFATSGNVAGRLRDSTGLEAEVMPHPPAPLAYRCDGYDDFILSVNRLDRAKRIDLLLEAAAAEPALRVVIAGDGPDRERLERLARDRGLDGRAEFAGRVSRRAARRSLRALPRRVLRAGRRGLRDGAVRGVPLREAGADDDGRRRPARRRPRPRDGPRRRAERRGRRARVRVAARARGRGAGVRPRRARGRARA